MSILDNPKHTGKVNKAVNKAVESLNKVGGLSKLNPTQAEAAQILNFVSEAYEAMIQRFQPKQQAEKKTFSLVS